MPGIGLQCHKLRIYDGDRAWRLVYHVAADAIVVLEVFAKKSQTTPKAVLEMCRKRFRAYQQASVP
jgi:phage-related protein